MFMKQSSWKSNFFVLPLISFGLCFFLPISSKAQLIYQPYSYQFYQKMNSVQYSWETRQHTAVKPLIIDSVMKPLYDSLMNIGVRERVTWVGRKIWNEHLIEIEKEDYTFYADYLPDLQLGRDFSGGGKNIWLNTRGFQVGGTVKDKFFFYTSGYENQAVFPDYVTDYINENEVVPGQSFGKLAKEAKDWAYVSAIVGYSPVKHLNFSLAYDKNFIGDGYRSMLLSDVSSNYTSLKFKGVFGDIAVTSMLSYMLEPRMSQALEFGRSSSQRKWGAFQYVDWNVDNKLSIGLFHSYLWGHRKLAMDNSLGFETGYKEGSSGEMQIGLNTKYKVLRNASLYGQLLLNKEMAAQLGIRGYNAFGIRQLNFLAEYNFAKPYSYSDVDPLTSYTNYSQPLAHPMGANFRELVGILNYSYHKFDFSLQGNYGIYGLDLPGSLNETEGNYGKDIYKPYNKDLAYDRGIGQGLKTNMIYIDGKVSYMLNPNHNLRIEAGGVIRRESNENRETNSSLLTIGVRASFRNLYYDF